jgi:hypothetical protein
LVRGQPWEIVCEERKKERRKEGRKKRKKQQNKKQLMLVRTQEKKIHYTLWVGR